MEKITKGICQAVRASIPRELADWAKDVGFEVEVGNMRYGDDHIKVSLTLTLAGSLRPEEKAYDMWVNVVGDDLPPRGTQVRLRSGKVRTVWGWNAKAPKFPVMLADAAGNVDLKTTVKSVKDAEVLDADD